MHDRDELRTWHQRHAGLLREAEVRRLAKASQAASQARIHRIVALEWKPQRHVGRAARLLVRSRRVRRELTGKGAT